MNKFIWKFRSPGVNQNHFKHAKPLIFNYQVPVNYTCPCSWEISTNLPSGVVSCLRKLMVMHAGYYSAPMNRSVKVFSLCSHVIKVITFDKFMTQSISDASSGDSHSQTRRQFHGKPIHQNNLVKFTIFYSCCWPSTWNNIFYESTLNTTFCIFIIWRFSFWRFHMRQ